VDLITHYLEVIWKRMGDLIEWGINKSGEKLGENVPDSRPIDKIATSRRMSKDMQELYGEYSKLLKYSDQAKETVDAFCWGVVQEVLDPPLDTLLSPLVQAYFGLCSKLLTYEGYFPLPEIDFSKEHSFGEIWKLTEQVRHCLDFFEKRENQEEITSDLRLFGKNLLPKISLTDEEALGTAPLITLLPEAGKTLKAMLPYLVELGGLEGNGLFSRLGKQTGEKLMAFSGINDDRDNVATIQMKVATALKDKSPHELIERYLRDTPFEDFFATSLPFTIPLETRFSHTHIVAGSGHGKTQLMQKMILQDFGMLTKGQVSIILIDSQGDMFRTVSHLRATGQISKRVVIIDPTDIDYPPALNLFDFGLGRMNTYDRLTQQTLVNGVIDVCEYMFGAFLRAPLTPRQRLIFRYIARLLLIVPEATIETMRDFLQEPERAAPYIDKLDGNTREFFKKQFFSNEFDDTRGQILTRVWGVLENTTLEHMFCNKRNKVNIYEAMNQGSLILINTAKDFLKQEGTEFLGRFFIALICQAAQERASIPADERMPTFVYIDEAHDYFDESIEKLLEQARKYKVGMLLAHQHLDQFKDNLRSTVRTNTAIKLTGGLSGKDARAFSEDMRTSPEYLLSMRKDGEKKQTQFACFVKDLTRSPIALTIPLGTMEKEPTMSQAEHAALIAANRLRVCNFDDDPDNPLPPTSNGSDPDNPELL
jgi:hypothetical protein